MALLERRDLGVVVGVSLVQLGEELLIHLFASWLRDL